MTGNKLDKCTLSNYRVKAARFQFSLIICACNVTGKVFNGKRTRVATILSYTLKKNFTNSYLEGKVIGELK